MSLLRSKTTERPSLWSGQPPGGGGGGWQGGRHPGPHTGEREDPGLHPAGRDVLRHLPGLAGERGVGGGGEAGDGGQTAGHGLVAEDPPFRRTGCPPVRL